MGNAAGGVHMAALGGLWQAVVFGFAGVSLSAEGPRSPVLFTDRGVELFTFDELDQMVSETYAMWREVCEERSADARRRGAAGGGGLL